jgi:hypothetical protein
MFLNQDYADSSDEEQIFSHSRSKIRSKITDTPEWEQPTFSKRTDTKSSQFEQKGKQLGGKPMKLNVPTRNYQLDLPPREDEPQSKPGSISHKQKPVVNAQPQLAVLPEHKQPVYLRKDWKEKILYGDNTNSSRAGYAGDNQPYPDGNLSRSWVGRIDRQASRDKYDYSHIPSKLIATDYEKSTDYSRLSGKDESHAPIFRTDADDHCEYQNYYHQKKNAGMSNTCYDMREGSRKKTTNSNKLSIETGVIQICLAPANKQMSTIVCPNCHHCIKPSQRDQSHSKSSSNLKSSETITEQLLKMVQGNQKQNLGRSFQESSLNTSKTPNRSSVEAPGNYLKPKPKQVLKDSSSINLSTDYNRRHYPGLDLSNLGGEKPIFRTDTDWQHSKSGIIPSRENSKENLMREQMDRSQVSDLKKSSVNANNRSVSPMSYAEQYDRNDQLAQKIYYQKVKSSAQPRRDALVSEKLRGGLTTGARENLGYSHTLLQQSSKAKSGNNQTSRVVLKGPGIR